MRKLLLFLLVLSLAANVAFLVFKTGGTAFAKTKTVTGSADVGGASASNSKLPAELAAALASGDETALKAAGFPDDDAHALALGRSFARLVAQMRALRAKAQPEDGKDYWRGRGSLVAGATSDQLAELNKIWREYRDIIFHALGDDDEDFFAGRNRYRFLSPEKRAEIRRIERDYQEMTAEVRRLQAGISLPSDQAKLELLRKEQERDILAALSPEERELRELYASPTAEIVRGHYGDLIQTEDDYKKIFALYKASGQRSQGGETARADLRQKLEDKVLAVLGDEAFAAYRKRNDSDLLALGALQTRLNLPTGTIEQVYALRDTYAAQSQAINADTSLTSAQRKEQLTALATQAKNEAAAKLGQEGADAYAKRSPWIAMLNRGQAFTTNPKDTTDNANLRSTVFPVRASSRATN